MLARYGRPLGPTGVSYEHEFIDAPAVQAVRQFPVTVLNTSSNDNAFSQYLTQMVKGFVQSQKLVPEGELDAWEAELDELNRNGEYWFSSTPIITYALKPE